MIKVKLESLDKNVITPRTGKNCVQAETSRLPVEGQRQSFFYFNEDCESPGVSMMTECIERIGNEIKFYDNEKRPFMITILD